MSMTIVDPTKIRFQTGNTKTPLLSDIKFGDYMSAAMGPATQAVALKAPGYNSAALTQATMTGVIGTQSTMTGNAANTPYTIGTASTPFSSGGYGYTGATYSPGYAGVGAGVGTSIPGAYGATSPTGLGGTAGTSQDYQEKQALFTQMNDANWEMLVAQVTVNDLSRDYQARSNILKTKSDAEANSVRNMKA